VSGVITPQVVRWAAQECSWQQSGELSVAWLIEGWQYAHRRRKRPFTFKNILTLGAIVEPRHNRNGLRQVGVRVGFEVKMDWQLVDSTLRQLVAAAPSVGDCTPQEASAWFMAYEDCHPFRDGNGRTGSILHL
jgi:hypothetical protein